MRVKKNVIRDGVQLWECTGCKQFLPAEAFYPHKDNRISGITARCKSCHTQQNIKTRDPDNARRVNREYMRRLRQTNPEKVRLREKLAARNRPKTEKMKVREVFNHAMVSGKIIKPSNCSQCGKLRKVTAHHDDYSKPLEVRWLCYECHGRQTVIDRGH